MALQESLPVYGARRTNRAQGLHAGVLSGQRYCTDPRAAGTGLGPRSMAGPRQASAAAGGSSVRPQAYRLGMVAKSSWPGLLWSVVPGDGGGPGQQPGTGDRRQCSRKPF